MFVYEVYEKMTKREYWSFYIFDTTGNVTLGHCNSVYPYADIPDAIKHMEVESISPCTESLFVIASCVFESTYNSEERAIMDGYEKVYDHPVRGPVYAKAYTQEGTTKYSFANIAGYS